jgi:uncharacterized membrane protein YdjX (TVP38/TMEM64 family)
VVALFQALARFVNNMDARAATSALVMLGLLAAITLLILFGAELFGVTPAGVQDAMGEVADRPFAVLGVILVYCALAMTGFPQAILIAGTVAVFGVWRGVPYAWIATMASATLTFALGHFMGARFVKRLSAGRALSMIEVMRERGAWASMIVRVVPSAPFIVVNAVCGAAHIPMWKFWLGTGLGILPKILFLSLFTDQVDDIVRFFRSRDPGHIAVLLVLVAAWIGFLVLARWLYMRMRARVLAERSVEE